MKRRTLLITLTCVGFIIALVFLLWGVLDRNEVRYTIVDLGTVAEGKGLETSWATAINDVGQVVGRHRTPTEDFRAFIWDATHGMVDLRAFGVELRTAEDINSKGEVVGSMLFRGKDQSGQRPEPSHAYLWSEKLGLFDLHPASAEASYAAEINEEGAVIGRFRRDGGIYQAVRWDANGNLEILFPDSNGPSWEGGINECGDVVGVRGTVQGGKCDAYVRKGTQEVVLLPTLRGYQGSGAKAIDRSGTIYGFCRIWNEPMLTMVPVQWKDGVINELESLGYGRPDHRCNPHEVNSKGQIVGEASWSKRSLKETLKYWYSQIRLWLGCPVTPPMAIQDVTEKRAVVWNRGHIHDLNDLIPQNSGWLLLSASDINERGQIVGFGLHNGQQRSFLLTPSEEPPESDR